MKSQIKGLGISHKQLTHREKTLLVDALRQTYTLAELLTEVSLPRSCYFHHRARLDAADRYVDVRRTMTEIFERNHRCYGYRRIQASLNKLSISISEKVVQRLMKQECLVAATPKRRRYGSYLGEISPAPDNLMNRDYQAPAPNKMLPLRLSHPATNGQSCIPAAVPTIVGLAGYRASPMPG